MKEQNIIENENEKIPNFIRTFSKENPEYRDRIAKSLESERQEFFKNKHNNQEYIKELSKQIKSTEKEIEGITLEIKKLKQDLLHTPWYKFKTKEEIGCSIEDLENGDIYGDYEKGLVYQKIHLESLMERKEKIISELNTPYDLPETLLQKIDHFYDSEKIRWKNEEFSAEDIEKYFSDEVLEKLSLEEYLALWERFRSAVQTHSIRQGVRDHIGKDIMGFACHNIGEKKYFDNFKSVLQDGHIKIQ